MMGLLTKNLGWKLLSLLLAMLLWTVIVRDPDLATLITAPVHFRGMPENLEISSEMVSTVQLEVRGPSGQLTPDNLTNAAVVLDLGNVDRPGDRTYTLEASNVSLPNGVFFSRAMPSQIRIEFERRISREVPVRVQVSTDPPEGYRVERTVVVPESFRVVGPESNVQQLGFVDTDSIDLSSVVASDDFQVNAYISDPRIRFVSSSQVRVTVQVQRISE